jgi:hypothetical protein
MNYNVASIPRNSFVNAIVIYYRPSHKFELGHIFFEGLICCLCIMILSRSLMTTQQHILTFQDYFPNFAQEVRL